MLYANLAPAKLMLLPLRAYPRPAPEPPPDALDGAEPPTGRDGHVCPSSPQAEWGCRCSTAFSNAKRRGRACRNHRPRSVTGHSGPWCSGELRGRTLGNRHTRVVHSAVRSEGGDGWMAFLVDLDEEASISRGMPSVLNCARPARSAPSGYCVASSRVASWFDDERDGMPRRA